MHPFTRFVEFIASRRRRSAPDLAVAKIARLTDTDLLLFASSYGQYLLREELQQRRARRRGRR
jgi:hypothetical protein